MSSVVGRHVVYVVMCPPEYMCVRADIDVGFAIGGWEIQPAGRRWWCCRDKKGLPPPLLVSAPD